MARTGTFTFCFTDIERSTALLGVLGPERYDQTLEGLRRLSRDAFQRHDGREVTVEGDGMLVVFDHAPNALAACLDLQLALAEADLAFGLDLRVRIGLHTGEALETDAGDYVGIPLHQASRVMAAANGGQTFLSDTTWDAARSSPLPEFGGIDDLGPFHLRDVPEPIHIWELTHAGLTPVAKPPRAAPAVVHNLTVPRTSFVGRADDLEQLVKLVGRESMVTITGAGGIGKTRVALEVAARATAMFPDGVWLVELAPLQSGTLAAAAVAQAVGGAPTGKQSVTEALTEHLASRRLLLILDNCEHIIDAVADLASQIAANAPEVVVLATSRQPLGLRGEQVWRLPPLEVDVAGGFAGDAEAVQLFVQRAASGDQRFRPDAAALARIAAICRLLDGIPLAIELAAGQVGERSLDVVANELEQSVANLAGGFRTDPPRQRAVRAAIDWTLQGLSPDDLIAFRRLPVFAGGIPQEAIGKVVGLHPLDEARAGRAFDRLARHSLVEVAAEEPMRYRMLEPVRQYAAELLEESGERDAVAEAHLDWYLVFFGDRVGDLSRMFASPTQIGTAPEEMPPDVIAEVDNLRAALETARASADDRFLHLTIGLAAVLPSCGHMQEARKNLKDALARPEGYPGHRFIAISNAASLAAVQGDLAEAGRLVDQLYAMKEATERPIFRALINVQAAALAMARGRPLKAEAQLRTALEIFDELGDVRGSVNARANLATALIRQLRIPEARAELESVLAAAKGLREHRVAVTAACNLASLAGMTGDHEAARAAFSAAIDELAGIDDPDLLSQITVNHAVALHQLGGREEEAADQFRRGAIIARRSANSSLLVTAAEGLAEIAWREGDLAAATESYERVMVTSDASGQPAARSRSRGALAALAAETGDDAGATHLLVDALGLLPEGDPRTVAWLLRFGSRVWAGRDPERAARLLGACDAAAARSLISDWSDQQRQQLELEVRAKLGDLTSDLIEAGRTLSEDEALALARP